jgi:hypothetical protein
VARDTDVRLKVLFSCPAVTSHALTGDWEEGFKAYRALQKQRVALDVGGFSVREPAFVNVNVCMCLGMRVPATETLAPSANPRCHPLPFLLCVKHTSS